MRTLFVLHNDLLTEENLLRYVKTFPSWELIVTSTVGGATKPYYWALTGTGPRVMPDTWSQSEANDFYSIHLGTVLVSAQLKEQDYEEIISVVAGRSIDRTPQVV